MEYIHDDDPIYMYIILYTCICDGIYTCISSSTHPTTSQNSPWNPEQLKGKSKHSKTAMHAMMLQEVERMQEVLRTVRSTLQVKNIYIYIS